MALAVYRFLHIRFSQPLPVERIRSSSTSKFLPNGHIKFKIGLIFTYAVCKSPFLDYDGYRMKTTTVFSLFTYTGIFNTIFHSDARPTTGVLSVRFYKLTTGKMSTFDIGSHFCGHKFRIGPLIADLQSGNIVLDATTNEVPEYLALAFSMALLTALCVPKVAKWTDDRSPYADRMNLVLASGFNLIHSSQRYTGQCSRIFSTPNDNATDVGGRQDDDSLNTYDDIDNAEGLGPSNTRFEGVLEPDPRVTDGAHGTND